MAHKHYNMCRGRRLGSNPSAQPHDLLFGISYYHKSEHKARGGRTGWGHGQAAVAVSIPPPRESQARQ